MISDLIMDMVDNIIDGVYANVSRINPETLSPTARGFLKALRESIREHQKIDKRLGNLVVKTLIKYHNDTGESLIPRITELVTVAFFVTSPYRHYAPKIAEFVILGAIFAVLTISDSDEEIIDLIQQTIVAIMTNPIYEFTSQERQAIGAVIYRVNGYLATLNKFSNRFTGYLGLIEQALHEGLKEALEICNAPAEEINHALDNKKFVLHQLSGVLFFGIYLAWPMFNITSSALAKWINSKTGLEVWPQKKEHF